MSCGGNPLQDVRSTGLRGTINNSQHTGSLVPFGRLHALAVGGILNTLFTHIAITGNPELAGSDIPVVLGKNSGHKAGHYQKKKNNNAIHKISFTVNKKIFLRDSSAAYALPQPHLQGLTVTSRNK
jgi:hypothetical protein